MKQLYRNFEKMIDLLIHLIIMVLIAIVLIGMVELVYNIIMTSITIGTMDSLTVMIQDVATFFIFLEIILMLLKYLKDIHHVPVKYLIIISITAIAREILLAHGDALRMIYLSLAILILMIVVYVIQKSNIISDDDL
ncbi:phosphate-starvation-inducible PsiE family protein [Vagococcus xieshaowenii]|uniref:Protein PsiE n=1 Tax=Vagococcus xieshaowenii TaxID=2562451 RepID=A0ABX5TF26_9ENTE|nr:phosphate-starvation-inducible PsiE family protein [Vagococcus xieshaowenii]QCA28564.1 phosphate-starvation-inducible protein PsiE [Vagococcus xieshaowenii]